jgi:oligoribonuclease NrnB/cAMP/cGMP phosphodiesterase (DHH superfamily)
MTPDPALLTRIVTHDDLDGVVSAALVSLALSIDRVFFAGPVNIQGGRTPTTESDVVCDLPCPVRVGMWFDHHPGNLEDLRLREIDPSSIPGKFAAEPSCARVVYEYFKGEARFPEFMADTVKGTDRVDSFDYRTMDEWREPTPERKLADAMFAASTDRRGYYPFMEKVLRLLRTGSMEEALADPEVAGMVQQYQLSEEKSLVLFEQDSCFHPDDPEQEVAIVDLTRHNRRPEVNRSAAFILHPEARAVLLVGNAFSGGKKTNNLSFSMSLSFLMNRVEHEKDIGEIMRELNIGDGHPGAAGGRIDCRSKDEMLKTKQQTIDAIIRLWKEM